METVIIDWRISMVDIVKFCDNFSEALFKDETKEDILLSSVSIKLSNLYTLQSERFDAILNELSHSIDTDDIEYTHTVIKKLSKSLSNNREQLLSLLEGVNNYGTF